MHYEAFHSVYRKVILLGLIETFSHYSFSSFRVFLFLVSSTIPRHMQWSAVCSIFCRAIWKWIISLQISPIWYSALWILAILVSLESVKSPQLKKSTALYFSLSSLCLGLETFSKQWTVLIKECASLVSHLSWNVIYFWLSSNLLNAFASYNCSDIFVVLGWQNRSFSILLHWTRIKMYP